MIALCRDYLNNVWRSFNSLNKILSLSDEWRQIVFYAEYRADWAQMRDVLNQLVTERKRKITCICSDAADPVLQQQTQQIKAFYIGSGTARTMLFKMIKAKAMVMTMTDLDSYHLKRSEHPVHYFYIFHALISAHGGYRTHAFDGYDSIFCVGPHHIAEIREQEKIYRLKSKNLLEGGYCRIDKLVEQKTESRPEANAEPTVLVAPTWGPASMVDNNLLENVIDNLVGNKIKTILRLHPMTLRHQPQLGNQLTQRYSNTPNFIFDDRPEATDSLLKADMIIADHGGTAIEFTLGLEKPAIYVATSAKIYNPERHKIELPLFEDQIRNNTGKIIEPNEIDKLPQVVLEILQTRQNWSEKLSKVRKENIFNVGNSAKVMADYIHNFTTSH